MGSSSALRIPSAIDAFLCNITGYANGGLSLSNMSNIYEAETTSGGGLSFVHSDIEGDGANVAATQPAVTTLLTLSITTWAGLLTGLLLIFTALGNTLVCIAIAWDKRLQNMTNYFLMSLAVTDFMVALLVMPFGIIVVVKGAFPLSHVYCVVWITLDVLFCTCSILHLCTLSVDRYLSLRYPIKYGRNKTKRRVVLKICLVWMTSVAMSVPLSLMYSRDDQEVIKNGMCSIQDPLYMTIGSIISFYIPLLIMLVTHALTMRLLKEAENSKNFKIITKECGSARNSGQVGTGGNGSRNSAATAADSPFSFRQTSSTNWKRLLSKTNSNVSTSTEADASEALNMLELQRLSTPDDTPQNQQRRSLQHRFRVTETQMMSISASTPHSSCPLQLLPPSPSSKGCGDERRPSTESQRKDGGDDSSSEEVWVEVAIDPSGRTDSVCLRPFTGEHPNCVSSSSKHNDDGNCFSCGVTQSGRYAFCCGGSVIETDHASAYTSTPAPYNNHRTCTAGGHSVEHNSTPNKTGWQEPRSAPRMSQGSDESPRFCEVIIPTASRATSIRRSTTRQGRYIQSERKATKVLGIIFFTFVILWTPFFSLNIIAGLCPSCGQEISPTVSYVVLWLGYASSTVNPLFYTIFNPTFRQTFARILTLQYK